MRCVDVKAFQSSEDSRHCMGIHQVGTKVAEYALDNVSLTKGLGWSPFAVDRRHGRSQRLIQECENLHPGKGFAVALEDAVGIATELGVLMHRNFELFTGAEAYRRPLAVASAIEQIEAAVRAQARGAEEAAAEDLANQMQGQPDIGVLFSSDYARRKQAQIESMRTVTEAEAKRAEDEAWGKYRVKFDEGAAKAWKDSFDAALRDYDAKFIAPLAKAHVAWMKSPAMVAQFECNHDAKDPQAGIVYAKTMQMCIGSTQDKGACFDLYTQWLDGDVHDKENLLLRALILNLDKTADDIASALKVSLDWRGFPLDGLAGSVGKATERVAELKADALGKLIALVLGPLAKWLTGATDGKVRPGMVILSLHANKPFVVVEVTGSKKAFRAALIRQLVKATGQAVTARQMERAVSTELKRLQIAGEKLDATEKKRFLLMLDPEQARGAPPGLNGSQRAQWMAQSIRTPEQVERELGVSDWRLKVASPSAQMVRGSIPYVFGLIAAVLQFNGMRKLAEDEGKAMSHEKNEAKQRLWAGTAALAGTITEMVGQGLERLVPLVPRYAAQWVTYGAKALGWLGKGAGLAGALLMAAWDIRQSVQAVQEKQYGLAIAYLGSAALGVGAAALLMVGWTGVGLAVVAVLIVVAVIIENVKDNKIQDWLERCLWGKGPASRYQTLEEEMAQLRIAVG